MKCFFTSSPIDFQTRQLNPDNGFVHQLHDAIARTQTALFVCADPIGHRQTDAFKDSLQTSMRQAGFSFDVWTVLDSRNQGQAQSLIKKADLIILAGGHVPTQNQFFTHIRLRKLLETYTGVILGISAGSMNSADIVYAQPELTGEAIDSSYQRFLTGLNLTKTMIIPHFQTIQDTSLDGLNIIKDIICPDSMEHCFLALPDGSYIYKDNIKEEIHGKAYRITDGLITLISSDDQIVSVSDQIY